MVCYNLVKKQQVENLINLQKVFKLALALSLLTVCKASARIPKLQRTRGSGQLHHPDDASDRTWCRGGLAELPEGASSTHTRVVQETMMMAVTDLRAKRPPIIVGMGYAVYSPSEDAAEKKLLHVGLEGLT